MKPLTRGILAALTWLFGTLGFIWFMNQLSPIAKWWMIHCHNNQYLFILPILVVISIPICFMWYKK